MKKWVYHLFIEREHKENTRENTRHTPHKKTPTRFLEISHKSLEHSRCLSWVHSSRCLSWVHSSWVHSSRCLSWVHSSWVHSSRCLSWVHSSRCLSWVHSSRCLSWVHLIISSGLGLQESKSGRVYNHNSVSPTICYEVLSSDPDQCPLHFHLANDVDEGLVVSNQVIPLCLHLADITIHIAFLITCMCS